MIQRLLELVTEERNAILKALDERTPDSFKSIGSMFVQSDFPALLKTCVDDARLRQDVVQYQQLESLRDARGTMIGVAQDYLRPYVEPRMVAMRADGTKLPPPPQSGEVEDRMQAALNAIAKELHDTLIMAEPRQVATEQVRADDSEWPGITDTATRLGKSKSVISRMLTDGVLRDNGKTGNDRRVNPASILKYCCETGAAYNNS